MKNNLARTSPTPSNIDALCDAFVSRTAKIGVIGLGYVGLPLAAAACDKGFTAIGFDTDPSKAERLNRGESYIGAVTSEKVKTFVTDGRLQPVPDFSRLPECDAIIMCVPTPLNKNREPDMSYIVDTTEVISKYLRKGQLVVLESTTWPGTTRQLVGPMLEEATGLKSGVDFYLAFSPEREDPGNETFHTAIIPKVVGGDGPDALRLAVTMYGQFLAKIVPVSSPEVAEAVKITENVFRGVNIALVNELKTVYDAMGIDIWEVIEGAKTKPFGYMPFYPGPGLGGHCIPLDPFYLTWKAREHGLSARFIELSGEVNVAMPAYVVSRLSEAMDLKFARPLNGAKVLMIGMAYKKNISDVRESPAFAVMELLKKRKANVTFHDPHVDEIPPTREHAAFTGLKSVALTPDTVKAQDAVVIITDHGCIDYAMIAKNAKLVVDTRNAMAFAADRSNIVKA